MKKVSVPITAICLVLSYAVSMVQAAGDSTFVITSGKDDYWKVGTPTEVTSNATITVNESQKYQKFNGFAGTFNEMGWDALKKLSDSDREKAMKLLFDKNDGIGFVWGRIPIGASDYGSNRYTLNENADDYNMEKFSIERDKGCLIQYIKAAQAIKPNLKFWASPWTPPTWMKTGATDAAGYDGGTMRNEEKYLKANALYLTKFCEAYKGEGIQIHAICPQNEPGYTQNYPSCGWGKYRTPDNKDVNNAEYLSTFVANYLIPAIEEKVPETEIWFGTLSNDKFAADYWNGAKSKAAQKIKAIGLQWNNVSLAQTVSSAGGYLVVQSEHQCGNYPWKSTTNSVESANRDNFLASMAPNNHAYGEESWDLIKNWIATGNVNVYSAWNMVLDTKGFNLDEKRKWPQNALLAVDVDAKTLKITPAYYVFRHIAQYVDTGSTRIGAQGGNAMSFLNPNGSIVTVAYNSGTSASQTTISVSGKKYQVSIPAKGWATLVVNWEKPVKTNDAVSHNAKRSGLRVSCKANGYSVNLPSNQAGRIELLTANGRVLESRQIPQGSHQILLGKHASYNGMLLVRVVNGSEIKTARFLAY